MRFSALFCCTSANLKKSHSETDIQATSKPLHPTVRLLLPPCSRPYSLIFLSQDYATTAYSISTPQAGNPSSKKTKSEPYTPQRALDLFKLYVDEEAQDSIGLEGFERLCKDADMPMEGTRPLIFCWQMQAKEMGRITKDEWLQGMAVLK